MDALADTFGKNVDDFAHVVAREMRVFVQAELNKLAARHSGTTTTDTTLAKRTGALSRALKTGGTVHDAAKIADVAGESVFPARTAFTNTGARFARSPGNTCLSRSPTPSTLTGHPSGANPGNA